QTVTGPVLAVEFVGARGKDVILILLALVGLGRHRRGLGLDEYVRKFRKALVQVEDQSVFVGGLDTVETGQGFVLCGIGSPVVVAVGQQFPEVGGAVGQFPGIEITAGDRVLDVLGGDRGAVLVAQPLLKTQGPLGGVVVGSGHLRRQVGDEFGASFSRLACVGQQGTRVIASEVPAECVIRVSRVG